MIQISSGTAPKRGGSQESTGGARQGFMNGSLCPVQLRRLLGSVLNTRNGRDRPGKAAGKEGGAGRAGCPDKPLDVAGGLLRATAERRADFGPGLRPSSVTMRLASLPPRSLPWPKIDSVTTVAGIEYGP